MADTEYTKVKTTASCPHCCDQCGGKIYYLGAGAFECRKCARTIYSDYGIVRKYIDEHGMTTIFELERKTGVPREVLEEFERDGTLYDPYEEINKCYGCGCVIEEGRYCKECQKNLIGRLADAMRPETDETPVRKPGYIQRKNTRMHYLKNE